MTRTSQNIHVGDCRLVPLQDLEQNVDFWVSLDNVTFDVYTVIHIDHDCELVFVELNGRDLYIGGFDEDLCDVFRINNDGNIFE